MDRLQAALDQLMPSTWCPRRCSMALIACSMVLGTALSGYLFGWGTVLRYSGARGALWLLLSIASLSVVTFPLIGFCGIWACRAAVPHSVLGIARLMTLQAFGLAAGHLGAALLVGGYAMGRHGHGDSTDRYPGHPPGGWVPMLLVSLSTLVLQSLAAWQLTRYANVLQALPILDWEATPRVASPSTTHTTFTVTAMAVEPVGRQSWVAGSIADARRHSSRPTSIPPGARHPTIPAPPATQGRSGARPISAAPEMATSVDGRPRSLWGGLTKYELVYGTMQTPTDGGLLESFSPGSVLGA
ncbi:hypothetical protein CXG81DRAFT_23063 [Caulochytrium protostelioides]|uniref:Uncharacterized protein n=1 Tax=Caulochytrium protostelioides TaxID=1555241 RepID=A0A4P9XFD6_9FUNG|nr:hypothetical protein CXG81DRAFT_23063 [Caulochytrium protostelioides]|eukprot:RKP04287.1 hypothetical protein CXG81DRAFT_23063 [Caulochytrium protostelioides]